MSTDGSERARRRSGLSALADGEVDAGRRRGRRARPGRDDAAAARDLACLAPDRRRAAFRGPGVDPPRATSAFSLALRVRLAAEPVVLAPEPLPAGAGRVARPAAAGCGRRRSRPASSWSSAPSLLLGRPARRRRRRRRSPAVDAAGAAERAVVAGRAARAGAAGSRRVVGRRPADPRRRSSSATWRRTSSSPARRRSACRRHSCAARPSTPRRAERDRRRAAVALARSR